VDKLLIFCDRIHRVRRYVGLDKTQLHIVSFITNEEACGKIWPTVSVTKLYARL